MIDAKFCAELLRARSGQPTTLEVRVQLPSQLRLKGAFPLLPVV